MGRGDSTHKSRAIAQPMGCQCVSPALRERAVDGCNRRFQAGRLQQVHGGTPMVSRKDDAGHRHALAWRQTGGLGCLLLAAAALVLGTQTAHAAPDVICTGGTLGAAPLTADLPDLQVKGLCFVPLGRSSYYRNVNILDGGTLRFYEALPITNFRTDFWAASIIVESGGALVANAIQSLGENLVPFGSLGSVLTIHLYGKNESRWNAARQKFDIENLGTPCKSPLADRNGNQMGPCGIPWAIWDNRGDQPVGLPGGVTDYFYQYGPLYGDGRCGNDTAFDASQGNCPGSTKDKPVASGYFGNKVLAVAYGATVDLQGFKGATTPPEPEAEPLGTGRSWRRLADGQSLPPAATWLFLEKDPALTDLRWSPDDEIVVTTTDYLPGHSERLRIRKIDASDPKGIKIDFDAPDNPRGGKGGAQWWHNGIRYGGPNDTSGPVIDTTKNQWTRRLEGRVRDSLDPKLVQNGAETRAAVALLSRSIQIVSAGDVPDLESNFGFSRTRASGGTEDPNYSYGAHMVIRQGFKSVHIRGVEFRQMGQGGRKAHYPVHFHMARRTPDGTFVKDSSINESMTRWVVLHSTQGVTLARNVGYKSIGHGFYLEDGTEIDNKFHSNIGIFARAAIANKVHNPRSVPGILADNQDPHRPDFRSPNVANPGLPYRSDVEHPTIFWITNGWNDFIGNMAAGAGTCGAAYWLVPVANMNMTEVSKYKAGQTWLGYAGLQKNRDYVGTTPLKSFYMNYATSAMHSFQTTADAPPCHGVIAYDATPSADYAVVKAVGSDAPRPLRHTVVSTKKPPDPPHTEPDAYNDHFYPNAFGGIRHAMHCPSDGKGGYDCSTVKVCAHGLDADKEPAQQCGVTVVDHFTTSFHWAEGNVSAVWLRSNWHLFTNSVISDVQNGGLTFVSGGDYTRSSLPAGYWALARNSVFIGHTNNHPDVANNNPYASDIGPFNARTGLKCEHLPTKGAPQYCLSADQGISMPATTFFTNQRLANIYDGPSYQDALAYLDITTTDCPFKLVGDCIYGYGPAFLLLRREPGNEDPEKCYVPNAAIGWKQPNGFFYPPAFHTNNLFFDNVELRHYVIDPLFKENTYITDSDATRKHYCTGSTDFFNNWTSIDRQTELNDDDGSLTGLSNTIGADRPHIRQTISINDDAFFSAPVETAECGPIP
jgi:cell migration-inducing and hyaluronan-binding protein